MASAYAQIYSRFLTITEYDVPLENLMGGHWRPVSNEGKQKLLNSIKQCMTQGTEDIASGVVKSETSSLRHCMIFSTS